MVILSFFIGLERDDPIQRLDEEDGDEWKQEAPTLVHARIQRKIQGNIDVQFGIIGTRYEVLVCCFNYLSHSKWQFLFVADIEE